MTEYVVKSMFCFLILYLGYIGVFRNSRNYGLNRIVLLFSVLFALVVPALKVTSESLPVVLIERNAPFQKAMFFQSSLRGSEALTTIIKSGSNDLSQIAFAIYMSGCLLLAVRFIFNISVLLTKAHTSEKKDHNGIKLTLIDGLGNPFTFFHTVFISRAIYHNARLEEELILHELAHKKQLHSVDVVLFELIQVFFWFNPFVYLFKTLVKANHEYLADDFVLKSGVACSDYSNKLIDYTFRRKVLGIASGFNHGFIKSRLIRLSKFNQKRRPAYRLTFFIPLIALLFTSTAFRNPMVSMGGSGKSDGVFYANTIFWSAGAKEIWLKGKMKVKFGQNDFTGDGSFSVFDKGSLLIVDGKKPVLNSSIVITGKKCNVAILNKDQATAKYGAEGNMGAVEVTTSQ
ncbi:MAG TPA: M56 family metallopeptidase [Pedobacter sp.]|nr:M56 family metallopeptidase [Pedobacter sp.]